MVSSVVPSWISRSPKRVVSSRLNPLARLRASAWIAVLCSIASIGSTSPFSSYAAAVSPFLTHNSCAQLQSRVNKTFMKLPQQPFHFRRKLRPGTQTINIPNKPYMKRLKINFRTAFVIILLSSAMFSQGCCYKFREILLLSDSGTTFPKQVTQLAAFLTADCPIFYIVHGRLLPWMGR